jgi:hypothetical protein
MGKEKYVYDNQNNIIKIEYSFGKQIIFERPSNFIIKEFHVYKNQNKTLEIIYYLNKKNEIVKTYWYNDSGNVVNGFTNNYDNNGNKIESAILTSSGEKFDIKKMKYDAHGNVIEEYSVFSTGYNKYQFLYEFDKKGNWIKKITLDLKENLIHSITIRKIIYR